MSAFTEIAYEKRGPVRIIRFNRPQVRNCIGAVTHRELVEAWTQFRDDESALIAIITGTGEKSFSTGGDLKPDLKPQAPSEDRRARSWRASRRARAQPLDRYLQAHYRRSEWYSVCGRPRMGVFR
jgi:enoyl-CoA hydratase